jgi:integrase
VGAHSINKEILLLSQILKKAKLWRRLRDDYKPLPTQPSDIGRALSRGELGALAQVAQTDVAWEAAFYGSVLAANCGLRGGEIKKLRIKVIDLERRRLLILRKTTKTNAGARHIELNLDAREAAWRLWLRARRLGATDPDHYLMPKHLSRIMYGPDKGKRGYDPTQHQ